MAYQENEKRLASMRQSGIPFREVPPRFVGDPLVNPNYEKKYAELNAAVFAFSAARQSDLDFIPDESPDFEVRRKGHAVEFIEIVQITSRMQAQYNGLLDQVNVAVRIRSKGDLEFARRVDHVFCEILLPEPPKKRDRARLVDELTAFLASGSLNVSEAQMIDIGDRYPYLHAAGARAIAVNRTGIGYLAFRKPPNTGDSVDINLVLELLSEKRNLAASYRGSPLGLVMYSDDASRPSSMEIPNVIQQLLHVDFDIAPFERVLIGGQRQILEVTASKSSSFTCDLG